MLFKKDLVVNETVNIQTNSPKKEVFGRLYKGVPLRFQLVIKTDKTIITIFASVHQRDAALC